MKHCEDELKKLDLFDEKESDDEEDKGHDWGTWLFVICKVGVGDA